MNLLDKTIKQPVFAIGGRLKNRDMKSFSVESGEGINIAERRTKPKSNSEALKLFKAPNKGRSLTIPAKLNVREVTGTYSQIDVIGRDIISKNNAVSIGTESDSKAISKFSKMYTSFITRSKDNRSKDSGSKKDKFNYQAVLSRNLAVENPKFPKKRNPFAKPSASSESIRRSRYRANVTGRTTQAIKSR